MPILDFNTFKRRDLHDIIERIEQMDIAKYIDHTNLKSTATVEILRFRGGKKYGFYSVL